MNKTELLERARPDGLTGPCARRLSQLASPGSNSVISGFLSMGLGSGGTLRKSAGLHGDPPG